MTPKRKRRIAMSETDIIEIRATLDRIERLSLIGAKNVLDVQEAAIYTRLSKQHIYRLTSNKQIPHFKKARKLYFKKSELEDWMLESKVLTEEEVQREAETYTEAHKRR